MSWELATPFGIEISSQAHAWHSGRVNALLMLGSGELLVGSDCGGVWQIRPSGEVFAASNTWDNPDIGCLVGGPRGRRDAFAGSLCGITAETRESIVLGEEIPAALWETVDDGSALLAWRQIPLVDSAGKPVNTGSIVRMAVVRQKGALVLACANGVFWSAIPLSGLNYAFQPVFPLSGPFSGVAVGPGGRVVMAAWGTGDEPRNGFFYADWQGKNLGLASRANLVGTHLEGGMRRTNVVSCVADPSRMYALAAGKDDRLYAVYRSSGVGAGTLWEPCQTLILGGTDHIDDDPGEGEQEETPSHLGYYTTALGVSSVLPNVVAFGLAAGPYISVDGGKHWERHDPKDTPHLHADMHDIHFDANDPSGHRFLVGSDGGIAVTPDLGHTWSSDLNAHLPTLQCCRGWASFGTSPAISGLLAAGHQDTGNLYCRVNPGTGSWRQLEGGDGQVNQFLSDGRLIRHNNTGVVNGTEFGAIARIAEWISSRDNFADSKIIPVEGSSGGLLAPTISLTVVQGTWRGDHESDAVVVAVATGYNSNRLYVLTDANIRGLRWTEVANISASSIGNIKAIASYDGTRILLGTDTGRIFVFDSVARSLSEMSIVLPRGRRKGAIYGFALVERRAVVAIAQTSPVETLLFSANGNPFKRATDPQSGVRLWCVLARGREVWVGTDTRVHRSFDLGLNWQDVSEGLPARPHCARLSTMHNAAGSDFVALATCGRSVWKFRLGDRHDVSCGTTSFIQSDFPKGAEHGNFEALILEGSQLVHYWHDNADNTSPWRRGQVVFDRVAGDASLIQGNLGEGNHGNFEAVILEATASADRHDLCHWYRDNSRDESPWIRGARITSNAVYPGCIIQGNFRSGTRGNLEVLVAERDPHTNALELWHWFRQGDRILSPWVRAKRVSSRVAGPACFIQGDYPKHAQHGNFEALVLEEGVNGNLEVWHYFHDNSSVSSEWVPIKRITDRAAGSPSLIQSDFSHGPHGNLEALIPIIDPVDGGIGLCHFWRDAAHPDGDWNDNHVVIKKARPASLIQSDYPRGAAHRNFEAVCHQGLDVRHYWRDSQSATFRWTAGQTVASDI